MANRRGPIPTSERENMMMDVDEPDNKGKNRKSVILFELNLFFF